MRDLTNRVITPVELEVLLHFYYRTDDLGIPTPAKTNATSRLLAVGLIQNNTERNPDDDDDSLYKLTDKGDVYVQAICCTPFPVPSWVVPD